MDARTLILQATLAMAMLALTGCPGQTESKAGLPAEVPADMAQATADPGIDFKKVDVGLPSRTLDFIGQNATGLAGARSGVKIYFGANEEGSTNLFCRDLRSFERTFVARIDGMQPATLACNADGGRLAYVRLRKISSYIDDPNVSYPDFLALPCRMQVETGEEEELFDFRDPAWRPYRSNQFSPFISRDGQQVVVLAYDLERMIIKQQVGDWMAMEADYRDRLASMPEKEQTETRDKLRLLLAAPNIAPLLKAEGVTVAETGEVTEQEREAMKRVYSANVKPQAALLMWRDGEKTLLPLQFAEDYTESYHFIISADKDTVLLGVQDLSSAPEADRLIFKVDLATGAVQEFTRYTGAPSSLELDAAGKNLMLVYNPVDLAARKVLTETRLKLLPLDGSAASEAKLPGDFLGFLDLNQDGSLIAGQDRDDNDLYLVDVKAGTKQRLLKLQAEISGIFLPEGGERVVYLDSGILYGIEVPAAPEASPDWISPEYFASYVTPISQFFTKLGFTVPADLQFEWEEKQGLGEHEISALLVNPAQPAATTLLRYSVKQQRVVSVWFTNGYPFPSDDKLKGGPLDFFGCKDRAEEALNRVGWLNPETRQEYHPGPNPLFDGKSNSYIVTFRDGYWMGSGDDKQWVINADATLRVRADTGVIAEMTVSELEQVASQPQSITMEKAVFLIRNEGDQPIPEDAPIKFDTDNYRLVLGQKRSDEWGPVKFQGQLQSRLAYEIDAYLQPENYLVLTSLVDTETGDVLGQLDYQPSGMAPVTN